MPPWYDTYTGKQKLEKELRLLAGHFSQFDFDILNDGTAIVEGNIGPGNELGSSYLVAAEWPYSYGNGRCPDVYLLDEDVPSDTPHHFGNGHICIHHGHFSSNQTMVDVLGWTSQWLRLYERFLFYGERW